MLDDKLLAMLGDKAAAERLTERGQLVPCPLFCVYGTSKEEVIRKWNTRAPILTPEQIKRLEKRSHDE